MHDWQKKYTTIYIDNKPVDLEKGNYKREDKETDETMKALAELYVLQFHRVNPDTQVEDSWLRNRFYNLFKNWEPLEFKIRKLDSSKISWSDVAFDHLIGRKY